jgi:hypothetical protein
MATRKGPVIPHRDDGMKQNKFIKECGPYKVHSISQDCHGVRLVIYPAFPQYNLIDRERAEEGIDESWVNEPRWALHRYKGDGGGPSIFTAIALANAFEEFLNQHYTENEIMAWKVTLDEALNERGR